MYKQEEFFNALDLAIPNAKDLNCNPAESGSIKEFLSLGKYCAQSPILEQAVTEAVKKALSTESGFQQAVEEYSRDKHHVVLKTHDKLQNYDKLVLDKNMLEAEVSILKEKLKVSDEKDIKEYVKLATVTEAPASIALHRLKSDPEMYELFLKDMEKAMDVLYTLDLWKKTIFYGKDYGCALKTKKSLLDKFLGLFRKKQELVMLTEESTRLLHGTIGIATESCELMQALSVYMKGVKPIDFTNVSEELADVGWYQNVMFDILGTNAEESFELWYKKLKLRYGYKFTEHAANNRKLEDERKLLEENT